LCQVKKKQKTEAKMKHLILVVALSRLAVPAIASGKIERACMKSDRQASRSLCKCIQRVANNQLTRTDQKLAAKFFRDPHLAQQTRQSDSASKERFWKRYKAFGQAASTACK